MRNLLDSAEFDDRTFCERCGANGLEPDEPCDCFDEEDSFSLVGGVPLAEVPPYSRDDFYAMLADDPQYSGLVDPDDFEIQLIATVMVLDRQVQALKKKLGLISNT